MNINRKGFNRILLLQLVLTFLVLLGTSFLSTVLEGEWRYYQLSMALVIISVTIVLCLLAGLPIRFNAKINAWWIHHQRVCLAGIICGFILLYLCWLPNFEVVTIAGYDTRTVTTNNYLAIPGWFLTAFCFLHLYPSARFSAAMRLS
jgi:hypothetical protein